MIILNLRKKSAASIVQKVDDEFDKGIYMNRTLRPYEWYREEDGEWKKGAAKSLQYRIYTNPPVLHQKRRHKFVDSMPSTGSKQQDIADDTGSLSPNMPVEGPPTSWYKKNGKWRQMKIDELGYIDPGSLYGQIIEKKVDDEQVEVDGDE
jgi:hypothetical protein